jgi:hypothetical protein
MEGDFVSRELSFVLNRVSFSAFGASLDESTASDPLFKTGRALSLNLFPRVCQKFSSVLCLEVSNQILLLKAESHRVMKVHGQG